MRKGLQQYHQVRFVLATDRWPWGPTWNVVNIPRATPLKKRNHKLQLSSWTGLWGIHFPLPALWPPCPDISATFFDCDKCWGEGVWGSKLTVQNSQGTNKKWLKLASQKKQGFVFSSHFKVDSRGLHASGAWSQWSHSVDISYQCVLVRSVHFLLFL